MVIQEEGKQGENPALARTAIITISSNGGSGNSTTMTIIAERIKMAVPMTSGISEKMPSVV